MVGGCTVVDCIVVLSHFNEYSKAFASGELSTK